MKKVLFCASTVSHIENFHLPYIREFKNRGWEVDVAVDRQDNIQDARRVIAFNFKKNIFSRNNIKAIFEIRKLIKQEKYDIISMHTTLASVIVRLGIMFLNHKPKIIYTCHGYLFQKDKSIKSKIYLGIEKICALVTDTLLVMNMEDLETAYQYKLYKNEVYYIRGMGIQIEKFKPIDKQKKYELRIEKGFSEFDIIYIYVAEFSKRKNHRLLLTAIKGIIDKMPNAKFILVGNGVLFEEMKLLVNHLSLDKQVIFTGYTNEVVQLYQISDIGISSSYVEGLPFNIMEAMASGLAILASNIKGHKELVEHGKNGYRYELNNIEELQHQILTIYKDDELRQKFSKESLKKIEKFNLKDVLYENMEIYENI